MKPLFFVIALSSFISCKTSSLTSGLKKNADDNTLLWEISGNGLKKPSFLYGTFHLMCKEDIHFSENAVNAIKKSDEVYFELDLDDLAGSLGTLVSLNMTDGKTLPELYTAQEYTRIEQYFKDTLHSSLANMQKMKPLFLISLLYPKLMPCKKMSGVEQEIMKIAKENGKKINGLETVAFQASMLDVIPYKKQAEELMKAIDSINEYRNNFASMLNVYKMQQLNEIEKLFTKAEFGLEQNLEVLLYGRNKNWVKQLKDILPVKSVFMAVGSGHLVGDKGVIQLLRKEGYTLKPISNN